MIYRRFECNTGPNTTKFWKIVLVELSVNSGRYKWKVHFGRHATTGHEVLSEKTWISKLQCCDAMQKKIEGKVKKGYVDTTDALYLNDLDNDRFFRVKAGRVLLRRAAVAAPFYTEEVKQEQYPEYLWEMIWTNNAQYQRISKEKSNELLLEDIAKMKREHTG
jgi:predicted DNA-binding WGR domain protein